MKMMAVVTVAGILLVGATGVRADTTISPATQPSRAQREQVKQDLQDLKADVAALRSARQSHDKVAVKAAVEKIKADWDALPPEAKKRIEEKRPKLFAMLKELRERRQHNANAPATQQG